MSLIEFIGFIISMLLLFVLLVKKSLDEMRRRNDPEEYERQEREQAEKLKAFLRGINADVDEDLFPEEELLEVAEASTPRPKINQKIHTSPKKPSARRGEQSPFLEERYRLPFASSGSSLARGHELTPLAEGDVYRVGLERGLQRPSRAEETLKHLRSRREMFIIQEIISKPKALR